MARPVPWRTDPANYPFRSKVPTRWADVDGLGHINNVAMAGLFEEGRIRFNRSLKLRNGGEDHRWLVVAVSIDYLAEAHYPLDVLVASGIGRTGSSSWSILSGAFQQGRCVATCETTLVYTTPEGPQALPSAFRTAFDTAVAGPDGAGR